MATKRKRIVLSLQQKLDIIEKLEHGSSIQKLATDYGIGETTVRNIRDNKEKLQTFIGKNLAASGQGEPSGSCKPNVRKIMRLSSNEKLDNSVYKWVLQERAKGSPISGPFIQAKALLLNKKINPDTNDETFTASKGWLSRFKSRHGIRQLSIQGEALSNNYVESTLFIEEISTEFQNFSREQIYNCDETGVLWKLLPRKTLVHARETHAPGYKMSKERVTILACCNAIGSHKLPLLIIGKPKKPRCFKNINMTQLPALYKNQKNAWMDAQIFKDWFYETFVPNVVRHCKDNNLPVKALLLLDNAPSHPFKDELIALGGDIAVRYMPPNTTALIQPMDQGILNQIKILYRKKLLLRLLAEANETKPLSEFLKEITLKDVVYIVAEAWSEVKSVTITKCWYNVWPPEEEGEEEENEDIENNVVSEMTAILNELPLTLSEPLLENDITDWINTDSEDTGYGHLTDEDLIEEQYNNENDNSEEEEIDQPTTGKDAKEAASAINTFIDWYEKQPDVDATQLLLLRQMQSKAYHAYYYSLKQKTLDDYFK